MTKLVELTLKPSRIHAFSLLFLHSLALLLLIAVSMEWVLKLLVFVFWSYWAWSSWVRYNRIRSIHSVCLSDEPLVVVNGEVKRIRLHGSTLNTPLLVILHFDFMDTGATPTRLEKILRITGGRKEYVPILKDAVPSEDLRKLRVWLKCRASTFLER